MKRGIVILLLVCILFISSCENIQKSRFEGGDNLYISEIIEDQIREPLRSYSDGWQMDYDWQSDFSDNFFDFYSGLNAYLCTVGGGEGVSCGGFAYEMFCYENKHPCDAWPQYESGEWECGVGDCGSACGLISNCDDGNPCTIDGCNLGSHQCTNTPMEAGDRCAVGAGIAMYDDIDSSNKRCMYESGEYDGDGLVCMSPRELGETCTVNLNCIYSTVMSTATGGPTTFCDDVNTPGTCQMHHCGNGEVDALFFEECDEGSNNDWWGVNSNCLPNCRLSVSVDEARGGPTNTGVPCTSDSDAISEDDWYCPMELPGFITDDNLCEHGFNIWNAGTIDTEEGVYNSGYDYSDRCINGPGGRKLLVEFWCDITKDCGQGQGCVMKQGNVDCAALVLDLQTSEIDPSVAGYTISCPSDADPTARPSCIGYPSPPNIPKCGNGVCGDCICVDESDWNTQCTGETCVREDCSTCPGAAVDGEWVTDCGFCAGNGECDDGSGLVANDGESCFSDCVDDNGDGLADDDTCLSQDLSGDNCGTCLADEHCGPFETLQNSAACAISDEFPIFGFVYVGGVDDDYGCNYGTSSSISFKGDIDSFAFSTGDCSWSSSESTDGCVAFAMEDDSGCGWLSKRLGTGCDDCAKGIILRGTVIDSYSYSSSIPRISASLGNWQSSYDATQPGNWWDITGSDAACVLDDWMYYSSITNPSNVPTHLCSLVTKPDGATVYKWLKCDKYNVEEIQYDTLFSKMYTCTENTIPCTSGCNGFSDFKQYDWVESDFLAGNCGPGNLREIYTKDSLRGFKEEFRCVSHEMKCKTEITGDCGVEDYIKYNWVKLDHSL